jgi:phosphoglycolate phosphatase-like HAD superfamily hydrolase
VIFDIDGTLVDSNDLHVDAWRVAFRRYGKELTHAQVHAQIGKGGDQLMPVFLTADELERFGTELEKYRVELFVRDYLPRAEPFPRVRELFERIRGEGLRIALASTRSRARTFSKRRSLGSAAGRTKPW